MGYRDDPAWKAMHSRYLDPPGDDSDERFVTSIEAACEMQRIERRYEP